MKIVTDVLAQTQDSLSVIFRLAMTEGTTRTCTI